MSNRKKSINLFLIIFIILLLIILIFAIQKLFNANTDDDTEKNTTNISMSIDVDSKNNTSKNLIENLDNFESINDSSNTILENNSTANQNINNQVTSSTQNTESTVNLLNHTYSLPNTVNFSKTQKGQDGNDYLLLKYPNYDFEIAYSTYKLSFDTLKSNNSLRKYLEDTFHISISSELKSGNLKNLDIIACSILEDSKPAYFIITPLNNSEIIYTKIYNTNNANQLISDLSDPLEQIGSMKSYLKN